MLRPWTVSGEQTSATDARATCPGNCPQLDENGDRTRRTVPPVQRYMRRHRFPCLRLWISVVPLLAALAVIIDRRPFPPASCQHKRHGRSLSDSRHKWVHSQVTDGCDTAVRHKRDECRIGEYDQLAQDRRQGDLVRLAFADQPVIEDLHVSVEPDRGRRGHIEDIAEEAPASDKSLSLAAVVGKRRQAGASRGAGSPTSRKPSGCSRTTATTSCRRPCASTWTGPRRRALAASRRACGIWRRAGSWMLAASKRRHLSVSAGSRNAGMALGSEHAGQGVAIKPTDRLLRVRA